MAPDTSPAKSVASAFGDEVPDDQLFDDVTVKVEPASVKRELPDDRPSASVKFVKAGFSRFSDAGESLGDDQLPAIEAPPEMHPGAVRAARVALKAGDRPDLCRLCVCTPKAGKQAMCKGCRSKIESCRASAKMLDQSEPDGETPNLNHLVSLEAAKDLTRLRMLVFDWELKSNPDGSKGNRGGSKRVDYDMLQYEEFWKSETVMDNLTMMKYLTKFRYLKYWQDEHGKTPAEAEVLWEKDLASNCARDYKGDDGEVRLKTKVDEYELMGNRMSRGNTVKGGLKETRKPKAGDIDAMMANLGMRQGSFDESFFAPVGGGENLRNIRGLDVTGAFSEQGGMVTGDKRKQSSRDDAIVAGSGSGNSAKIAKLKDKESKLNKMRNDLTDIIVDVEKSAAELLDKESEMNAELTEEEKQQSDYKPLLFTYHIRMFALKLLFVDTDIETGFNEFELLGEGDLKVTTETLALKKGVEVVQLFGSLLTANKRAMPTVDYNLAAPCKELLERIPGVGEEADTITDMKEVKTEFMGHIERLRDMIKATRQAHADIKSRKTAKASKKEREAERVAAQSQVQNRKVATQAVNAQKRVAKDALARELKMKKVSDVENHGRGAAPEWKILAQDLQRHPTVPKVSAKDFKLEDMNTDTPYIITDLDLACELKKHDEVISCWVAGFDRSDVVIQKGSSSWPLVDASQLRNTFEKYGPKSLTEIEKENPAFNKVLDNLCVFGYTGAMKGSRGETQSLASLRWQRDGSRTVIIANVDDIVRYLKEEAEPQVPSPVPADISATLKYADAAVVASLRARNCNLFHATVQPKDLLFQPAGWWILEVPNGGERNFGLHMSLLPVVAETSLAAKGFHAMMQVKLQSLISTPTVHEKTQRWHRCTNLIDHTCFCR